MHILKEEKTTQPCHFDKTLGIVSAMSGSELNEGIYLHLSFGRIVDELARRYKKVLLCIPMKNDKADRSRDYRLKADNIEVISQPFYNSSIASLKHFSVILKGYKKVCKQSDVLFFRGMEPYAGFLYFFAWLYKKHTCHWIVGNPVKLLRTHRRSGFIMDFLSILYALQDRFFAKLGRRLSGGAFICNGQEIGEIYKSTKTVVTVSTTITENEFFVREDTCKNNLVKILFIGFIRPEKGVEYLIEAAGMLNTERDWELILAGPWEKFSQYRKKLDEIINSMNIGSKVKWPGYVSYGPEMFKLMREADIFVLPTLSEGTPRVLVEARANSIPIIATNVGGIPTSVKDGYDGILVPPKNPEAIAQAIHKIIDDQKLRRSLIRNGLETTRNMTVDRFVDLVIKMIEQ